MQTLKSLFITALVLGAAFLAYDFFLAAPHDKVVYKQPPQTAPAGSPASPQAVPASSHMPAGSDLPSSSAPPVNPVPAAAPASPVAGQPQPQPSSSASSLPPGYVPPVIPDIEEATARWTRIPATAFPRQVKLLRPAAFTGTYGQTRMNAGSEVTALAFASGSLTIAPAPASPMRATVPVDDTDLKILLTTAYARWRDARLADAKLAWERSQKSPSPVASLTPSSQSAADGRPQASADGTYPLLLASMKSGMVTEVTPTSITRWGTPEPGDFNGKRCWNVPVDYDASTTFGKFSTTAVAKVVDGRVAGWFYLGSGEPVP